MAGNETSRAITSAGGDSPGAGEIGEGQKRFALTVVSFSHTLNHVQHSITSVLYPAMMSDLGFGMLGLGALAAISNLTGQGLQVIWGFLAAFFRRTVLLGLGNVLLGLSVVVHAFLGSYTQLIGARVFTSLASSPQHPIGASILSRFFPKARGWALTVHHTAGSAGSFLAPAVASFLLIYMGWRAVFIALGVPGLLLGLVFFFIRDRTASERLDGRRKTARASLNAYLQCFKNRNIIVTSLVLMVGAAGRGTGINNTYLVPYFMKQFDVSASSGGFLLTLMLGAGLVGPLLIGWLSDHYWKRSAILQVTLLFSAVMTVWLAHHAVLGPWLFLNLILYGAVVQSRGSLTQAMIGDYASEELTDAAFSVYYFVGFVSGPIWTLLTGYLIDHYGFAPAFYLAASTYLAGMVMLTFVKDR
jgi:MFS family permease